jgi:DNA-binding protein YbaB
MELKLKPIENMLGYEQIDKQLWQLKDKMYEIEAKYRQSGVSNNSDEDILLAKVNVQRELIPR